MNLRALIDGLDARVIGDANVEISGVQSDSRAVKPGDLFVAIKGLRADGHEFAATVNAAAVVVEREVVGVKVPQIVVADSTRALGILTGRMFGDPASAMTLIAVTGTNGKTTTTYLVEAILAAAGHKPGVIGTVELRWPGHVEAASYTTPTPHMLHEALAKMRAAGCTHVVMEVTSIALAAQRVAGMMFEVAAFSNLTQDHLDYHGSMAGYRDAKRLLFTRHLKGTAVVNVDDEAGEGMAAGAPKTLRVTAAGKPGEIRVVEQDSSVKGITAKIATPLGELAIQAKPLIGHYNVENLALSVGIGVALGIPHDAIAKGIAAIAGVPGRVQRVANDADLDIFVDYAHTPDALTNVLSAMRPLTKRRLLCVFGCGGDRDPTKRPKMGAAVAELADLAFVTSDNPRTEDPRAIIDQILPGIPKPFFVDVDRRVAIRAAICEATPGDVIVIAGKGHEDYQIIGTTKHHFDDREEAAAAILERFRRSTAALQDDIEEGEWGILLGFHGEPGTRVSRLVIDSRIAAPGDLYVAIVGETHDGHAFTGKAIEAGAVAVMVCGQETPASEPGGGKVVARPRVHDIESKAATIIVDDTRLAYGSIAAAHRKRWTGRLVAITGSAGKTTTKDLTRAALAVAGPTHGATGSLNNETGVPTTLLGLRPFHAYAVVEMGMRGAKQIEYLTKLAEPDVAVVVNAGSAHIELLGSTDAIAQAKAEIWMGLREGGTIVRPVDDLRLDRWAREHQPTARHVTFGETGADVALVEYAPLDAGGKLVIDIFDERRELVIGLVGKHAAIDACAALAAAHAAGASIEQALAGLARAKPPAMRGEVVEVGGRKIIVDCYNANPASMAASLRALAERGKGKTTVAVVGDMLELGEHAPKAHADVGALVKELGLGVIALGEHATRVVDAAGAGDRVETPADAAARVLERTQPGDWILLKASRGMRLERVLDAIKEKVR
ncbi:MAG: UDP-N-acetylmuramoyl-L-alanyl-D-glutamate--2,6-diaminopimelate ligase [Myxococcota bacterium]|nr:UDP-N-acetylmuramoyl-L-alanyl-D-glutamate--2,6-diaminopimelate ligase [Myxococcota bacterium]